MTKIIKISLLATAALTAVSALAHADGLSDLKSVMEALKIRDVFSQYAVQIPKGYTIYPAADSAPADTGAPVDDIFNEVKISGYIKTGFIYSDVKTGTPLTPQRNFDTEAGLNVKGSVQSSLGEVGASLQMKWDIAEAVNNGASFALRDEGFVGFWQFADTMKLEMGRSNYGRIENGIDKNTRRIWTVANRRVRQENAGNGFFDRDAYNSFAGLAYTSGPIALNIRAHDATRGVTGALGSDADALGLSAKAIYTGEAISFDAAGGYWTDGSASNLAIASQTGVKWLAGVGTSIDAIPGVALSFGGQIGQLHSGANMWNASGSVGITLSDTVNMGFGAGIKNISGQPGVITNGDLSDHTEKVVVGGLYYSPLTALILGVEGDYLDDGKAAGFATNPHNDGLTGAIVARYNFAQ